MIEFDTSPEGGSCKFIAKYGEGMRGYLLSVNKDQTEGVVIALMDSFEGEVKRGRLYLIQEYDPTKHPNQEKEVKRIPNNHEILRLQSIEGVLN